MYQTDDKEIIKTINALAKHVNKEIMQGKPGNRCPGDEGKMSKADVLRKTGLSKKTLNAILKGYEPDPEKEGLKSLPSTETLMKLCNAFDCELEYLLGFQDHKVEEIGTASDITGLSEKAVQRLANLNKGPWYECLDVIDSLLTWEGLPTVIERIVEEKRRTYVKSRFVDSPNFEHLYNLYTKARVFSQRRYAETLRKEICREVGTPIENMEIKTPRTHFLGELTTDAINTLYAQYMENQAVLVPSMLDNEVVKALHPELAEKCKGEPITEQERQALIEENELLTSQLDVLNYEAGLADLYEAEGRRHGIVKAFEAFVDEVLDEAEQSMIEDIQFERECENAEK